ncbi:MULTISPECIES: alpha/beta hydrolase [unclassified Diaminobutyricimonas]|uniref:alpha/beta hydrolase n=1 Tax=unclassified Diaminobutyricimonas TaxID=2643261 RepID=UPI0012F4A841|nr:MULTISPECIES: alpha/beta hydrolase [unclassified Diaminobutyricimonas]
MPLDPFFTERLQTHRRYLFGRAVDRMKTVFRWPWRFGRPSSDRAEVAAAELAQTSTGGLAAPPAADLELRRAGREPRRKRAQFRRAALNWDRKELRTVGTAGPDLHIVEHEVAVNGYPSVRVRIYYPFEPAAAERASHSRLPAVLAFFGGGFRIGGIDYPTTDAAFRRRAAEARIAVVAVDYALAPEHRFPVPVEQGHAALTWLFDQALTLGIDPSRIGIAGISAGGNIAAAVTLVNRDRGNLPLRLQMLEVPVVDLTGGHIDYAPTRAMGIPSVLAARELRSVVKTYLRDRAHAKDPLASPLRAESHADLPPAFVLTAEYDPLRGDGAAYAAALRNAGVEASAVQYLGVTHDVAYFTRVLPAARRWHDDVIAILSSLHE